MSVMSFINFVFLPLIFMAGMLVLLNFLARTRLYTASAWAFAPKRAPWLWPFTVGALFGIGLLTVWVVFYAMFGVTFLDILRTAAAFGVTAVVVQDRHAPPQSGALAKAASGALEIVPYVEVVNITRTLDELAERGFWRIALAGDGADPLTKVIPNGDIALVLGSEGDGIRRLVREHCEAAAFIPISKSVESLNVSNAAAIALYEMRRS